ncbi:hypothetical protein MLD38_014265 [Melastoma candidum]|nr:hypothetical protein MLD38_014265 [Melastoma candidum]
MLAQQWFQSIDRRIYELPAERVVVAGIGRVGMNGRSSRLDPMQESWLGKGEGWFQSFDDFAGDAYCQRLDRPAHVPLRRWQSAIDESEVKEIQVDTFVRGSELPPPEALPPEQARRKPPPNPPPPPTPPTATQKKRPAHDCDAVGAAATPPPPPPPPPPRREQSPERIERRKSSATAELKVIIASVLSANKRKKRKPKARIMEGSVSVRHGADEMPDRRIPPPTPPPPPQRQSFLSIFKRTTKTRRIHSTSAQPQHPPSSPPDHPRRSTTKPPLPKKPKNNHEGGNAMQLPAGTPAALLPPLPQQPLSFSSNGRRRSRESGIAGADYDASGSPGGKKRGTSSSDGGEANGRGHVDGGDAGKGGPGLFCESPDVNVKADTFIARLKDGWRMERMNSIREKHGLGPDP